MHCEILYKTTALGYDAFMDSLPQTVWIDACAHRLHQRWRSAAPDQLEELAEDLWQDERLRSMQPAEAARACLEPLPNRATDAR